MTTLGSRGVDPGRLDLQGWKASATEHLSGYADVDIALDTYPYNGTTTTCEALWMGVPVVTQAGSSHVSRVGLSLLARCGLEGLAARDTEAYVGQAVALAGDPAALAALRAQLRDRLVGSGLLDAGRFVHELEEVYRACASARSGLRAERGVGRQRTRAGIGGFDQLHRLRALLLLLIEGLLLYGHRVHLWQIRTGRIDVHVFSAAL